jgi:hypothetical protein
MPLPPLGTAAKGPSVLAATLELDLSVKSFNAANYWVDRRFL